MPIKFSDIEIRDNGDDVHADWWNALRQAGMTLEGETSGLWTISGDDIYFTGGNVGIGTDDPLMRLHLRTGAAVGGSPTTTISDFRIERDGTAGIDIYTPDANSGRLNFGSPGNNTNAAIWVLNNSGNPYMAFRTANVERGRFDHQGRFGIGTTDPQALLEVSAVQTQDTGVEYVRIGGISGNSSTQLSIISHRASASANRRIELQSLDTNGSPQNIILNPSGGNIGIGITGPGSLLTIRGVGTTSSTSPLSVDNFNGDPILFVRDDRSVGIGIVTPSNRLHVRRETSPGAGILGSTARIDNAEFCQLVISSDRTSGNLGGIAFFDGNEVRGANILANTNGRLGFRHSTDEWMSITAAGNVGIHTTTPARRFHVVTTNGIRISPSALPGSPAAGDIALDSGDGNKLKYHNGTAWIDPAASGGGGGGGGAKNFMANGDAEAGLGSWQLLRNTTDGAEPTPDAAAGTVTGVTFEVEDSPPLAGTQSFKITKDAADRQGHFVLGDMLAIDNYLIGKKLWVSSVYLSTLPAGTIVPFIWNKTEDELVPLTRSGTSSIFQGSFHVEGSAGVADEYQWVFHIAGDTASAGEFIFDEVVVTPDALIGADVARSEEIDLTSSGDLDTGRLRVSQDSSGAVVVSLIEDMTCSALAAPASGAGIIPEWAIPENQETQVYDSSSSQVLRMAVNTNGSVSFTARNYSGDLQTQTGASANASVSYNVPKPAQAMLSTTELLNETAKFSGTHSSSVSFPDNTTVEITINQVVWDTSGTFDPSENGYRIPANGYYRLHGSIGFSGGSEGERRQVEVSVNGSTVVRSNIAAPTGGISSGAGLGRAQASKTMYLQKDDLINLRGYVRTSGTVTSETSPNDTFLEVIADPDFSVYGAVGQFEVLAKTSAQKAASTSAHFLAMVGNEIDLTPGVWLLPSTLVDFATSGTSAGYSRLWAAWYGSNGADSATEPTQLNTVSDVELIGHDIPNAGLIDLTTSSGTAAFRINTPSIILRVKKPTTVYLVPRPFGTAVSNARVTVYPQAQRIQ